MSSDADLSVEAVARISAVPTVLRVISEVTGLRLALVARVTPDCWTACAVLDRMDFGLVPGQQLDLVTTLCRDVMMEKRAIVIDCASDDPQFRDHPTPKMYGFESYISVPIFRRDGSYFGNVCALDAKPVRLKERNVLAMLELHAELIGLQLEAEERQAATQEALLDERTTAELREQFIAVLGHDLRNPLAAIQSAARLLRSEPLSERAAHVVGMMQNSVTRMAAMIDNLLDLARGRLGGGLELDRNAGLPLVPVLEQVVAELRAAWPDRLIETELTTSRAVHCDRNRIAQLLSNLLANALMHGAPDQPVRVRALTDEDTFELSVANAGDPIPPATMGRLFQPFSRASVRRGQQGLGLGLYIASEIARAHDGTLEVASTPAETRFTFRMPAG